MISQKSKKFEKCPHCGSKKSVIRSVVEESIKMGLLKEGAIPGQWVSGLGIDPTNMSQVLIGSKVPAFGYRLDVCSSCGCYYALEYEVGEATLGAQVKGKPAPGIELARR